MIWFLSDVLHGITGTLTLIRAAEEELIKNKVDLFSCAFLKSCQRQTLQQLQANAVSAARVEPTAEPSLAFAGSHAVLSIADAC
jgi:hypothetical protein